MGRDSRAIAHPALLALALMCGALLAVAVVGLPAERATGIADVPARTPARELDQFLRDWRVWRTAEVVIDETELRRLAEDRDAGSGGLRTTTRIVQTSTERLVGTGDDVAGVVNGRAVGCAADPLGCRDDGPASRRADLADEMAAIRAELSGPRPRYRLRAIDGGCYLIRRIRARSSIRWGERAELCFDRRTGVFLSERIESGGVVIDTRRWVRATQVDPSLFTLPATPTEPAAAATGGEGVTITMGPDEST